MCQSVKQKDQAFLLFQGLAVFLHVSNTKCGPFKALGRFVRGDVGIFDRIDHRVIRIIVCEPRGKALPLQTEHNTFFGKLQNGCEKRNAHNHSKQSPKGAHRGQRDHHAKRTDSGVIAQDPRTDDVVVDLLDHDHNEQKRKQLFGRRQQQDQRGGNGANQGSDNGNDSTGLSYHRKLQTSA